MPDRPDEAPTTPSHELSEEVGARESRKARARSARDRTLWVGLGAFGVIGWSVAVPTLVGIVLGLWFDRLWPGRFSWTLALILAGVTLGSMSAWYWLSLESKAIEDEEKEAKR